MVSVFGHEMRSEVVALYLAETVVVLLMAYPLLELAAASWPGRNHLHLALAAISVAVSWSVAASVSGLYELSVLRNGKHLAFRSGLAASFLGPMASASVNLVSPSGVNVPWLVFALAVTLSSVAAVGLIRLGHLAAKRWGWRTHRVLIIDDFSAPNGIDYQYTDSFILLKSSDSLVLLEPGWLRTRRIWTVVYPNLCPLDPRSLRHCRDLGVRTMSQDQFREATLQRVAYDRLPEDWLLSSSAASTTSFSAFTRRSVDIAVSLALITLALPLMIITAILLKLDSNGPIFYPEQRYGQHMRPFLLLKFRTVVLDGNALGASENWTEAANTQTTLFGRIIRLSGIDELPQLFNILIGDMSIIGPNPDNYDSARTLSFWIARYGDRCVVKPGITGWAQIHHDGWGSLEDARMKLAYDLYYVKRISLFLDLVILLATIRIILLQKQIPRLLT